MLNSENGRKVRHKGKPTAAKGSISVYDVEEYKKKLGDFCSSGAGELRFEKPERGNGGMMIPTVFSKKGQKIVPSEFAPCDSIEGDSMTFVNAMNDIYNNLKAIEFGNLKAIMVACGISATLISVANNCRLDRRGLGRTQLYARLYCATVKEGTLEVRWFSLSEKFLPETISLIDYYSCAENALKVNQELLDKPLLEASGMCATFWTDRAGLAMIGPDADAEIMEQRKNLKKLKGLLPENLDLNVVGDEYKVLS
jgi:hypothetical protein